MSYRGTRKLQPVFGTSRTTGEKVPTTTVQETMNIEKGKRVTLSDEIVKMAEAEYERQYGQDQTAKQLRARGGLGFGEVLTLLGEALIRYAPKEELIPYSEREK